MHLHDAMEADLCFDTTSCFPYDLLKTCKASTPLMELELLEKPGASTTEVRKTQRLLLSARCIYCSSLTANVHHARPHICAPKPLCLETRRCVHRKRQVSARTGGARCAQWQNSGRSAREVSEDLNTCCQKHLEQFMIPGADVPDPKHPKAPSARALPLESAFLHVSRKPAVRSGKPQSKKPT